MSNNKKNYDTEKWLPIFITGAILIVVYMALAHLDTISNAVMRFFSILAPLLIGVLIAYFIYVPHRTVEKLLKKIRIKKFTFISDHARGISTVIMFLLVLVFIGLALSFLIPVAASSLVDLANSIPGYIQEIVNFINSIPFDTILEDIDIGAVLQQNAIGIIDTLLNSINTIQLGQAAGAVAGFFGGVFDVVLGIFLALYILLYRDELKEYFTRLNKAIFKNERRRNNVARYVGQANNVLLTFIASKGIDALCNFTAATLITTIFGVPYPVLLGLMAGLFNFIPYIGSIVSSAIISLLALLTCPLPIAIGVMISIFAFQQFDGNFIEPRIMKTTLKLNPILVIMAVVIGGAYFNIIGMFLGVPIAAIIKQLIAEYIESSEKLVPVSEKEEDIRR